MTDKTEKAGQSTRAEKGGYRPLNVGYSAIDDRRHGGAGSTPKLPKAPTGGTGETVLDSNSSSNGSKKPR